MTAVSMVISWRHDQFKIDLYASFFITFEIVGYIFSALKWSKLTGTSIVYGQLYNLQKHKRHTSKKQTLDSVNVYQFRCCQIIRFDIVMYPSHPKIVWCAES
ncbi:unnamed protein product [Albugo candida]|uniref:Uncharacterized protein n=1 Tax=Albugo candida TaxID=65357 RepID=A0A024GJF6_9STRA|nr:unnamed protein product [Albugo candida]|eukprot:CCI46667.1 unnamed protein product [Albugo candida]